MSKCKHLWEPHTYERTQRVCIKCGEWLPGWAVAEIDRLEAMIVSLEEENEQLARNGRRPD